MRPAQAYTLVSILASTAFFKPEQEESGKACAEGRGTSEIESRGLRAEHNNCLRRMEDGDAEAIALWQRFRNIGVERCISTCARLNTDSEKRGAKDVAFVIARERAGTNTYPLPDVAAVLEREETYAFDKMIYVASME